MGFNSQRFLRPPRLPFRHFGIPWRARSYRLALFQTFIIAKQAVQVNITTGVENTVRRSA